MLMFISHTCEFMACQSEDKCCVLIVQCSSVKECDE